MDSLLHSKDQRTVEAKTKLGEPRILVLKIFILLVIKKPAEVAILKRGSIL